MKEHTRLIACHFLQIKPMIFCIWQNVPRTIRGASRGQEKGNAEYDICPVCLKWPFVLPGYFYKYHSCAFSGKR